MCVDTFPPAKPARKASGLSSRKLRERKRLNRLVLGPGLAVAPWDHACIEPVMCPQPMSALQSKGLSEVSSSVHHCPVNSSPLVSSRACFAASICLAWDPSSSCVGTRYAPQHVLQSHIVVSHRRVDTAAQSAAHILMPLACLCPVLSSV